MSIEHAIYEMKGQYGFPMEEMNNNMHIFVSISRKVVDEIHLMKSKGI
jgi:hypothetical protein